MQSGKKKILIVIIILIIWIILEFIIKDMLNGLIPVVAGLNIICISPAFVAPFKFFYDHKSDKGRIKGKFIKDKWVYLGFIIILIVEFGIGYFLIPKLLEFFILFYELLLKSPLIGAVLFIFIAIVFIVFLFGMSMYLVSERFGKKYFKSLNSLIFY